MNLQEIVTASSNWFENEWNPGEEGDSPENYIKWFSPLGKVFTSENVNEYKPQKGDLIVGEMGPLDELYIYNGTKLLEANYGELGEPVDSDDFSFKAFMHDSAFLAIRPNVMIEQKKTTMNLKQIIKEEVFGVKQAISKIVEAYDLSEEEEQPETFIKTKLSSELVEKFVLKLMARHGDSIAEQAANILGIDYEQLSQSDIDSELSFEIDSQNKEPLEEQNPNALRYIMEFAENFKSNATLQQFAQELKSYLKTKHPENA